MALLVELPPSRGETKESQWAVVCALSLAAATRGLDPTVALEGSTTSLCCWVLRGSWCTPYVVVELEVWRSWGGGGMGKVGCKLEKQPSALHSPIVFGWGQPLWRARRKRRLA